MTDDIVARIRVWSSWLDERCPKTEVQNDLRIAADEIERLRAIVHNLDNATDRHPQLKQEGKAND